MSLNNKNNIEEVSHLNININEIRQEVAQDKISEARITTSFLSSDIQGVEEGGLIYAKFNSKLR